MTGPVVKPYETSLIGRHIRAYDEDQLARLRDFARSKGLIQVGRVSGDFACLGSLNLTKPERDLLVPLLLLSADFCLEWRDQKEIWMDPDNLSLGDMEKAILSIRKGEKARI